MTSTTASTTTTTAASTPMSTPTARRSVDALRALAEEGARELGPDATADEVAAWAARTFPGTLAVACSMADAVLPAVVANHAPGVAVLFLDTGYHFAETLGTRDAYAAMLPVTIRTILPRQSVAEQDAEHGPQLHDRNPDLCCALRKVEPLERALSTADAWVTGMRREDAPTRTDIDIIGWDARRGMVKLNPLAEWTQADLDRYVEENDVFLNPLRQSGFASIGCAPCTRAVAPGEDPRAGRWAGKNKTECGLHT